jgi:hypothetical protein
LDWYDLVLLLDDSLFGCCSLSQMIQLLWLLVAAPGYDISWFSLFVGLIL